MAVHALLLNADYAPMKVIRWERAIELVLESKAVTVASYEGKFVRSMSLAMPWPSVIVLKRYTRVRERVRYSSRNVQARDLWTCAYCGLRPRTPEGRPDRKMLTLDHVIPRAQAKKGEVFLPWSRKWVKVSCWENAVAACPNCNMRKADRTPQQANLTLRAYPRVPTQIDALRITLERITQVPPSWLEYLPEGWHTDPPEVERRAEGSSPSR